MQVLTRVFPISNIWSIPIPNKRKKNPLPEPSRLSSFSFHRPRRHVQPPSTRAVGRSVRVRLLPLSPWPAAAQLRGGFLASWFSFCASSLATSPPATGRNKPDLLPHRSLLSSAWRGDPSGLGLLSSFAAEGVVLGIMEGPSKPSQVVLSPEDAYLNSSTTSADTTSSSSKHVAKLRKLLFRRMLIGVNDGRYFLGLFHCIDKQGNIILQDAVEYRSAHRSSSPPTEQRCLGLILIPAACRSSCHVDCFIEEKMSLLSLDK